MCAKKLQQLTINSPKRLCLSREVTPVPPTPLFRRNWIIAGKSQDFPLCHSYIVGINRIIFPTFCSDTNALRKAKMVLNKQVRAKTLELENHLKKASFERKCYQRQGLESQNPANRTLLVSVDFKKGVVFPYFRRTVQQLYFLKRPVAQVFGLVNESTTPASCFLFFYGNDIGSAHWGNVVSLLDHWLQTVYLEQPGGSLLSPTLITVPHTGMLATPTSPTLHPGHHF